MCWYGCQSTCAPHENHDRDDKERSGYQMAVSPARNMCVVPLL